MSTHLDAIGLSEALWSLGKLEEREGAARMQVG
jgi:hypothetical protein